MAQFFKPKRRKPAGPSKNEQKVMRERIAENQARSAGLIRDRFPHVQKLSIQMEFLTPQQHVADQQTRVFGPADACDFSAPCPGRCGGKGSFNLEAKVAQVLNSRTPSSDGAGVCQEQLYSGTETCGFRLRCRIEASYTPSAS